MKYFTELTHLKHFDLYPVLQEMLDDGRLNWETLNQICINCPEGFDDPYMGCGSLKKDWSKKQEVVNESGEIEHIVPTRDIIYYDRQYTQLCSVFKGTLFEEVFEELKANYGIGRIRIMKSDPHLCLSWHADRTQRIHYPLKTQEGCFMVIEDEVKHLEKNKWYLTNTLHYHTAFNASEESRIHLLVNLSS